MSCRAAPKANAEVRSTKGPMTAAIRMALRLSALAASEVVLGGCAGPTGPAAWDKALLAKPEMTMSWNPLATRAQQQVYESKEAASGGYGVGGGGCGCN